MSTGEVFHSLTRANHRLYTSSVDDIVNQRSKLLYTLICCRFSGQQVVQHFGMQTWCGFVVGLRQAYEMIISELVISQILWICHSLGFVVHWLLYYLLYKWVHDKLKLVEFSPHRCSMYHCSHSQCSSYTTCHTVRVNTVPVYTVGYDLIRVAAGAS